MPALVQAVIPVSGIVFLKSCFIMTKSCTVALWILVIRRFVNIWFLFLKKV